MIATIPSFIQRIFADRIWHIPSSKEIYLTFDDGPHPEATPFVLDTLLGFDAKATFFCVGENVMRYPDIYHRIIEEGHTVGNHSHNHLNGWQTNTNTYIENIKKAAEYIESTLYRPPYGKVKPSQVKQIKDHYKIIMWDVLSLDYDPKISTKKCSNIVINKSKEGSIIVFHDNVKAMKNLKIALPLALNHFKKNEWQMVSITEERLERKRQSI